MELSDQGLLYLGFSLFYCFVIYWGMKALYEIKESAQAIRIEIIKLNMKKEFEEKTKQLEIEVCQAQEKIIKPVKKKAKK